MKQGWGLDGSDFNLIKCPLSERWFHEGRHRQTPTTIIKKTKSLGLKRETKAILGKIEIVRTYTTI